MIKVFQTIVDKDKGNCEQAVIASLLNLSLEDVPNFIEYRKSGQYDKTVMGWLHKKGYCACTIGKDRHGVKKLKEIAKFDGGFDGFFYAVVPSQTYKDITHAVVADINLKIVHDPNPNLRALKLKSKDIICIIVTKDMVIGKTGKLFTKADWDATSEEERDANTYKPIFDINHNIIGTEL
jgi:hypothetical protein